MKIELNKREDMNDLFDNGEQLQQKKTTFEKFLTYRRRMSRMFVIQATYIYSVSQKIDNEPKLDLFEQEVDLKSQVENLMIQINYFYNNVLNTNSEMNSRRIDQKYCNELIYEIIKNLNTVDEVITEHLSENWDINRIDEVIKAILRTAITESMSNYRIDTPILTSEYTNLASQFLNNKQIGFVNGVLDRTIKNIRKKIM